MPAGLTACVLLPPPLLLLVTCMMRASLALPFHQTPSHCHMTHSRALHRMVRMLAAGLVEVGHGRTSPEQLRAILKGGQRDRLPEAAPPHGLYLMRVFYDELPEEVPPELREAALTRGVGARRLKQLSTSSGGSEGGEGESSSDEGEGMGARDRDIEDDDDLQ